MASPSPLSGSRSLRWRAVATATMVSLVAAGLGFTESTALAVPPAAPAAKAVTHTVTLVTGDVVTVTTLADGQRTAEVDRPDDATGGVHIRQRGDDLYVLPDEALPLLNANRLDRRLFNVSELIEMGYDDATSGGLPVIATYPPAAARSTTPAAPRGSRTTRKLASIGGAALIADKRQARTFWNDVAPRSGGTLGQGLAKLWLDGRVRANLAESVPQVGAPQAWAAGYDGTGVIVAVLDSGIDATHPDLAGQITDKVSFVPGEDASDANGHGTHVASTVAGTGAASDGRYRGVAPGADLLIGKVLGSDGFGQDSWTIAGMQWAAESGADIVSMSLGDEFPSDGTDPMAVAVDTLTQQYGALFVVAAGNSGPGSTISTPAAAASALTVGAVDKQDWLAWFSSTGPLVGTGAMKPDITAPGVDITAARSQQMPPGDLYQAISGTSMATPHVSGAAAILAQQHPEWTAQRLKDALMSSAHGLDPVFTPYEVGTGRLDVAAAVRNTVQATGSAFFGNFDWPHAPSDGPVNRTVAFTNSGAAAVTLNLAVHNGPFRTAPAVTVPAGGSASVTVTGDLTTPAYGSLTGYLVGTDAATGTAVTRTALGVIKEPERYDLKITMLDRTGAPASGFVAVQKFGDFWPLGYPVNGQTTLRLPPGTYSVSTFLEVNGERADSLGLALLMDPETVLDGPAEVVLDARRARRLDTAAPQRTQDRQRRLDVRRVDTDGIDVRDAFLVPVKYDDLYVLPTERVTQGSFDLVTRWRKGEPMLTVDIPGMAPLSAVVQPGSALTKGSSTLKAVYAGTGAASSYAGVDARGRAVVVTRSDAVSPPERAAAAAAAGAALLLVVHDGAGALNEWVGESPIPIATLHRDEGAALVTRAKTGRLVLREERVPYASYLYDLTRNYTGQVPDRSLRYHPSQLDLARIDARYFATRDIEGSGFRYDMTFTPSFGFGEREAHPGSRTEWVTPDQVWHETHMQGTWEDRAYRNAYPRGSTTRLDWFAPVVRPAFSRGYFGPGRYRDFMTVNIQPWSPSGAVLEHGGTLGWGETPTNLKLYQGDTLIDENEFSADLQWVEVPPGTLPYRLVLDASRPGDEWRLSTRTHTEWRFISSSNTADDFVTFPLLQLDYDIETDLRGDVKAGGWQRIGLSAHMQAGATGGGQVTSISLDISYDDGATWQPVTLRRGAGGRWSGDVKLPNNPGFVSLRASAATGAGWSIQQEIIRGYGLR